MRDIYHKSWAVMPGRNPNNKLESWEISLVKAMIIQGSLNDQDILAYFTRPTRSINHARIKEIRDGVKHAGIVAAASGELGKFLQGWPHLDPATGLHLLGDELLIKAREAMLGAVQGYNNPRSIFKAEMFIVGAVIAWTYFLHWHYRRSGIDYRHYIKDESGASVVAKTKHGAEKHWELAQCISSKDCPIDDPTKANLNFLIEIRNEIEHQMTRRIDEAIGAKLQACCLNFNNALKALAGQRHGLDADLSIALQFATIDREQRDLLLKDMGLPAHILAMHAAFETDLPDELVRDRRYAYRVAFVEIAANSKGKADQAIEFIRAGSAEGEAISRILVKETEKKKYKPGQIVTKMQKEGYPKFRGHEHTQLWKLRDAKNPKKGYGVDLKAGESPGDWWWYDLWLDVVRLHCAENKSLYI